MADETQSKEQHPEGDLAEEFRILGQSLVAAMRTAWESPERKNLQQELQTGLDELGTTIRQEGEAFRESPTGQRLKSEFDDLQERIRSGEAENRLRQDLINLLQTINAELKKTTQRWTSAADQTAGEASGSAEPPNEAD